MSIKSSAQINIPIVFSFEIRSVNEVIKKYLDSIKDGSGEIGNIFDEEIVGGLKSIQNQIFKVNQYIEQMNERMKKLKGQIPAMIEKMNEKLRQYIELMKQMKVLKNGIDAKDKKGKKNQEIEGITTFSELSEKYSFLVAKMIEEKLFKRLKEDDEKFKSFYVDVFKTKIEEVMNDESINTTTQKLVLENVRESINRALEGRKLLTIKRAKEITEEIASLIVNEIGEELSNQKGLDEGVNSEIIKNVLPMVISDLIGNVIQESEKNKELMEKISETSEKISKYIESANKSLSTVSAVKLMFIAQMSRNIVKMVREASTFMPSEEILEETMQKIKEINESGLPKKIGSMNVKIRTIQNIVRNSLNSEALRNTANELEARMNVISSIYSIAMNLNKKLKELNIEQYKEAMENMRTFAQKIVEKRDREKAVQGSTALNELKESRASTKKLLQQLGENSEETKKIVSKMEDIIGRLDNYIRGVLPKIEENTKNSPIAGAELIKEEAKKSAKK